MNEWIRLQEDMLKLQRLQLDAARRMADAAGHGVQLQKSMMQAAETGARAWQGWLGLWGVGR